MSDEPLMQFKSHIQGRNADVRIYPDRIEWGQVRRSGPLFGKRENSEMIPIKAMSSVTSTREGFRFKVSVICPGNTVDFRIGKDEADRVKALLTDLMLGKHESQAASATNTAPLPPPPSNGQHSTADEIRKLVELRDAGALTDDEFAAQKAKLLG